jgi:vacuolar protein sorting-associated protein 13A/C
VLLDGDTPAGVLALSTADAALLLAGPVTEASGRLGTLSLVSQSGDSQSLSQNILSIEGENLVDFKYSAKPIVEREFNGIHSELTLQTAAVILHFLEQPLGRILHLLRKLSHMKALYDAAAQAAAAAETTTSASRLQFNIEIQSPIIVLPIGSSQDGDHFVMKLGQFEGKNDFKGTTNQMTVSLKGIHMESFFHRRDVLSNVKILEDVNMNIQVEQTLETQYGTGVG